MFVYLSKKIKIPDSGGLKCVAWSRSESWLAAGGAGGMLRVLRLEPSKKLLHGTPADLSPPPTNIESGIASPTSLTMNQELLGHKCQIQCTAWNSKHHKLTTSDEKGLIIVWVLYRGQWFEEMINNREASTVTDMEWTSDGTKICIVYEDGAVIVGSVEGNRLWGEELKDVSLHKVCWSPDGKLILFGTGKGEVHTYDSNGLFCTKVVITCLANFTGTIKLAGLKWYDGTRGFFEVDCPSLAVAYTNGRIQLMRNEADEAPVLVDTELTVYDLNWNNDGTILAIAGHGASASVDRVPNCVQFYNPMGQHLRTLKIPGVRIGSVDFDDTGLRVVAAVDYHLFFAHIRGQHKWGYCTSTVIYSYSTPMRPEHTVVFWDFKNDERHVKHVRLLNNICAYKEFCLLTAKNSDLPNQQVLVLCNSIGTPLEHSYIEMEAKFLAITEYHVFAANDVAIFIWEFKQRSRLGPNGPHIVPGTSAYRSSSHKGVERLVHIDDTPSGGSQGTVDYRQSRKETLDQIASIAASSAKLIVGRTSGVIQVYALPKVSLIVKLDLKCRPHTMALNMDSTYLSVIDLEGAAKIFAFEKWDSNGELGAYTTFARKDVWAVEWAEDDPDRFAVMEKTRMYIYRDMEPEEPIVSSAYICSFSNLEVTACLLDDIMKDPEHPSKDFVMEVETKSLRDSRDLISKVSVTEASQFIKDNAHPRLWHLLADSALENLDLTLAETAFIHCHDYAGTQFVKKLRRLNDDKKQRAEVESYFKRFETAEKSYINDDRRDLAVNLRTKLGDWFRVLQLLKAGHGAHAGGDDVALHQTLNAIGDYYTDRQKWKQAITYYVQSNNSAMLAQCYLKLEDYESLQTLADSVPAGVSLHQELGERFAAVGMCQDAVNAFLKVNNVKGAVDTCVQLNRWHQAVQLAKKHTLPNINVLLGRYATHLLDEKKVIDAVQLYREANMFAEAATLLYKQAAEKLLEKKGFAHARKMYIMAAMMMEDYRKSRQAAMKDHHQGTTALYLEEESNVPEVTKMLDTAWRGAEAIHFFIRAQRFIYDSNVNAALRMALLAAQYDDILAEEDIYTLQALASALVKCFKHTSQAFTHLDDMENLTGEFKEQLEDLAVTIFTQSNTRAGLTTDLPVGPCDNCHRPFECWMSQCPMCQHRHKYCVSDGRRLEPGVTYTHCQQCRNFYEPTQMGVGHDQLACPVCFVKHGKVTLTI